MSLVPLSDLPSETPETLVRVIAVLDGHACSTPDVGLFSTVRDAAAAEDWTERLMDSYVGDSKDDIATDSECEARGRVLSSIVEESKFRALMPDGFFDDIDLDSDVAGATESDTLSWLHQVMSKLANGQVAKLAILAALVDELEAATAHINEMPHFTKVTDEDSAKDWACQLVACLRDDGADAVRKERA